MKTNTSIIIYKQTKDWKGVVTETALGTFDVWLEHGNTYAYVNVQGQYVKELMGKGFVILGDEVDIKSGYIYHDNIRYEIKGIETFLDRRSNFHHMEFYYV